MSEQKIITEAITAILSQVRSETSDVFFTSMSLRLAEALKADYAEIGELLDDGRSVRTLSLIAQGTIRENITYDLAGTPCDNVVGKTICSYPSGAADRFPQDALLQQMGVEGYVGVPLFDSQLRPLGIMAAFYRSPIADPSFAETILQLFAMRVASEIERRRTEEALLRARTRFNTLYDHSPVPIWEEDFSRVKEYFASLRSSGVGELRPYLEAHPEAVSHCAGLVRVLDVNQESVAFFGVADKEAVVRNLPFYFTERSLPMFKDELIALWEGKQGFACDLPIRDMQRNERIVSLKLTIAPGHEQTWDMVLVSFHDITSRWNAEAALRESEVRLREAQRLAHIGSWEWDIDRQNLTWSDEVYRIFGLEPGAVAPSVALFESTIHPDDRADFLRRREEMLADRHSASIDHRIVLPDGSVHVVRENAELIFDDQGRVRRVIGTVQDITDRRFTETALHKSEARLREAQKIGRIGNWEFDVAGGSLWWSEEVYELFGMRSGAGVSFETFLQRIHPEDRQRVHDAIQSSIAAKMVSWQIEYRVLLDSGDVRFLHENATADLDVQGSVVLRRGIVQDVTERRRTEEALRENAEQFRALVEQSLTGVALIQDMQFVYVNPYLAKIIGYEPKEMIGRAPIEFVVAGDQDEVQERIRQRLSGDVDEAHYTFRAKHRSGAEVILEVFGRATTYQGKPATLSTLMDITERKKLEDVAGLDHRRMASLLKISQSKSASMKDLLDHALDEAVALSESRLGYIYYYDEGKREFVLHSWSRSVMQECSIADPPKVYQLEKTGIWGEAVRQRKPIVVNDFHAPHPLKKGYPEGHAPLRRFMTLPVFVDGRIVAVVGVANKEAEYDNTDVLQLASMMDSIWKIAEHRRLDDDLRKLSQAVEQSPVSIVITDTGGNIEFVNPRFTQITGYLPDEVLGRNPRVLKSGETPPETYQMLWAAITAGKVWEGDFHNKKKNGQLFWEHAAISPIRDNDGNITHYLGIKEDITERKKLEEQLRQAQKMEAIGQLAGGVAHDFNNILSTITGYASLLEMTVTSDETLREYISEITVASERGANLTKSLLAFSRKQEAVLAAVDLNQQIRSSHKILSRLIGEDIDLVLDLDRHDIIVDADASQLQQVLMNLASNARDAMPHGGSLRIATKIAVIGEDCQERYGLVRPGRYAKISLADTGVGIEQGVRDHIFEPFFTTKGIGKGTGLGLSIVFGMVQKHKGSVQVESEPGKGTVFTIYLPLSEKSVGGSALGDRARPRAGGQTILLVEDEEPVRRVIRLILESFGYKIIEASDGEEAVQIFRENRDRVHLVLCDLVMPKKNGSEAYAEMRNIRPDIKAIFMSGYTKDIFDKKGISDAEITLLMKPLNPLDLVGKISEALQEGPGLPPENR